MSQFLHPSADLFGAFDPGGGVTGRWYSPSPPAATQITQNIFSRISESVALADDTGYVWPLFDGNVTRVYVTALSGSLQTPIGPGDQIVRYRAARNNTPTTWTLQLVQGYVNEGAQGTLIEQWTDTPLLQNGPFTTISHSLTSPGLITDYTGLAYRFVVVEDGGVVQVSAAEFEVPDQFIPPPPGPTASVAAVGTTVAVRRAGGPPINPVTPADATPPVLSRTVVRVENFIDPMQVPDDIAFVLDERFREQSLQTLLDRSVLGSVGVVVRDAANALPVDLSSPTPVYVTALMKSRQYTAEAVTKTVARTFTELV